MKTIPASNPWEHFVTQTTFSVSHRSVKVQHEGGYNRMQSLRLAARDPAPVEIVPLDGGRKEVLISVEKSKDEEESSSANLGSNQEADPANDDEPTPSITSDNVTALLASAMNLVKDNPVLHDTIAEALNQVE